MLSKQVLMSNLAAAGFDVHLLNLKLGDDGEDLGVVNWNEHQLRKVYLGTSLSKLDPSAYDLWGVTSNFSQQRDIALLTTSHLASQGRPVIVGGSDAIAEPRMYIEAGASAIITDKSGSANAAVIDHLLKRPSERKPFGALLASGMPLPSRIGKPLRLDDWPLPTLSTVEQCLGSVYRNLPTGPGLGVYGSVVMDIGCDRKCDFCQTPRYKLGYQYMSPETARTWLSLQKEAGAQVIVNGSDQFLARLLWEGGRDAILEIMRSSRELGLAMTWGNGLELRKATLSRGFARAGDKLTPDEELLEALFGWDGEVGCYQAYIPAERPLTGRENYAKLLPWQEHCTMLEAIVRTGVPNIVYGVMIGFEDDSEESLQLLEEASLELKERLLAINPVLNFEFSPAALSPIPGTPQWKTVTESGFLRFYDPTVYGGFLTPSLDTRYLSYRDIARWQRRLLSSHHQELLVV